MRTSPKISTAARDPGRGRGGAAVGDAAERGEVGRGDARMVEQPVEVGHREIDVGDPVFGEGAQHGLGLEAVVQDHRAAGGQHRVRHRRRRVADGCDGQQRRGSPGIEAMGEAVDEFLTGAVALGHHFGAARAAAGELDGGERLRPYGREVRGQGGARRRLPGDRQHGQSGQPSGQPPPALGALLVHQEQERSDVPQQFGLGGQGERLGVGPRVHRPDVDGRGPQEVDGVAGAEHQGMVRSGEHAHRVAVSDAAGVQDGCRAEDGVAQFTRRDGGARPVHDGTGRIPFQCVQNPLRIGAVSGGHDPPIFKVGASQVG